MDTLASHLLELSRTWSAAHPGTAGVRALHDALSPHGLKVMVARIYPSDMARRGSAALWRAGGFVETRAPDGWEGSDEHAYICLRNNPLIAAPQAGVTRFLFTRYARPGTPPGDRYWEAWSRIGVDDGLGLVAFAHDGRTASLSLAFERMGDLAPIVVETAGLVGQSLLQGMLQERAVADAVPRLTLREREVMNLVARGLTDTDIARVLSIGPTTARAHVDNARRKLDASNRTEAAVLFSLLSPPERDGIEDERV